MEITDFEALLRDYGLRKSQDRTWDQAASRWLSLNSHKRDFQRDQLRLAWLSRHLSGLRLSDIDQDAVLGLSELKRSETSPSTANRYTALLRSILRAARDDWQWVHWIPRFHFFEEPEHRVRWLLPTEAARLISELPLHLSDMAIFSLATGLRQSNVTGLQWSSVDIPRRIAWVLGTDSKSKRAFSVPLNDAALVVLGRRLGRHKTHVFEYRGRVITRCSNSAWRKAKHRAGISDFRWHDWRHTWASWHVQSGTSLYELQELGGWKTLDMVLRYAHLGGDHMLAASKRIDDRIQELFRAVD